MQKIIDNIIKKIESNETYNKKEVLKLLVILIDKSVDEITNDFNNILKYKDLFHLLNNYLFDDLLYVDETLYYVKNSINYDELVKEKYSYYLKKIKNNTLDNNTFKELCDYLYLDNYKNIDQRFIDYIFRIKLLDESNSISNKLIKQLTNAYTYNKLKKLKVKNASSVFRKQEEVGLCSSSMFKTEDLSIEISYNNEILDMELPDLLETIHHELRHAEITRKIKKSINNYSYDIVKSYCISNLLDDTEENYKNDKQEIDASIYGAINTYKYLKKLFPSIKKTYFNTYKTLFENMNQRRNNNLCTISNKIYNKEEIFDNYIKIYDVYIKYSKLFPIIKYEYKLENKKVIRKSTVELIKDKQNCLNIFDYSFYDTLIKKRKLNKNDLIKDGYELLNCEDFNLFTEINEYLKGIYLEKLILEDDNPYDFYYKTMVDKIKESINNYNKKTPNNSIRVRCCDARSGI